VCPNCEWCGAAHNPWGAHAREGATVYEIWVDETGSVESALTIGGDAGVAEREARRRFARQLERLVIEECAATLRQPTAFQLDAESGFEYEPLFAPEHLHRPLSELIDLAWKDLSLPSIAADMAQCSVPDRHMEGRWKGRAG
jgi:hypothetical protein